MQAKLTGVFDYVLYRFFYWLPTSFVLIVGDWKTGKTDTALLIAERLLELGFVDKVASNIDCKGDPRVEWIYDLPTLREWLYEDRRRKLYILDEVQEHFHRRRATSKKNVALVTLLPEISKAKAYLIGCTHNPASADNELLSPVWLKGLIQKVSKKFAIVSSEPKILPPSGIKRWKNLPRTNIPFDPYDVAPFKLNRPTPIPERLKDKELQILWEWAVNKKPVRELGLHQMQLNRLVRKFVAQVLQAQIKEMETP